MWINLTSISCLCTQYAQGLFVFSTWFELKTGRTCLRKHGEPVWDLMCTFFISKYITILMKEPHYISCGSKCFACFYRRKKNEMFETSMVSSCLLHYLLSSCPNDCVFSDFVSSSCLVTCGTWCIMYCFLLSNYLSLSVLLLSAF